MKNFKSPLCLIYVTSIHCDTGLGSNEKASFYYYIEMSGQANP